MFAVSVFRDRKKTRLLGRSEVTQIHPLLLTTAATEEIPMKAKGTSQHAIEDTYDTPRMENARVGCSDNVHEQIMNEFMFSSVHVQFTKCCPLPSPFMNTRVQFMFSSRKKYVNTKRSFGPLSCCLRVLGPIWDLTCAARDAALLLRCNHVGRVILSSSSSRLLRSDPSRSWQPTFLATRSTCRSI